MKHQLKVLKIFNTPTNFQKFDLLIFHSLKVLIFKTKISYFQFDPMKSGEVVQKGLEKNKRVFHRFFELKFSLHP